jgi:hypothetical protein
LQYELRFRAGTPGSRGWWPDITVGTAVSH